MGLMRNLRDELDTTEVPSMVRMEYDFAIEDDVVSIEPITWRGKHAEDAAAAVAESTILIPRFLMDCAVDFQSLTGSESTSNEGLLIVHFNRVGRDQLWFHPDAWGKEDIRGEWIAEYTVATDQQTIFLAGDFPRGSRFNTMHKIPKNLVPHTMNEGEIARFPATGIHSPPIAGGPRLLLRSFFYSSRSG